MLFSFRAEGLKEEFEIFGAAGESIAGLFDTLRSAAVDLTADAVVLGEAAAATARALEESALPADSKRAVAVAEQRAKAKAFADSPVEVYLVSDGKDGLPVLLCRFPKGLREVARQAGLQACLLAKEVLATAGPATVETLAALDRAFDPSALPRRQAPAEAITVPDEGVEGGGGDFDADDLLTGTEGASPLGGKGALKIKKSK